VPRSTRELVAYAADKLNKVISRWSVCRLLRKAGLVYKRLRQSCKPYRKKADFEAFKERLQQFKADEDANKIDLMFLDEAGFSLRPAVPYGWQPIGVTKVIASRQGSNHSVLGALRRDNTFWYQVFEKAPKSDDIIAFINQIPLRRKTILILDNAPTHKSLLMKAKLPEWEQKGLFLVFLPPASPEHNYIEMLWRKIKHQWMPAKAYLSKAALHEALVQILKGIGKEYQIHFA
jgi:transposase